MSDVPERPTGPPEPFGPAEPPYIRPERARSRPGRRVAVSVAGVAALLAAAFGVASLAQGDGASSAEGAVEDLFDAIADEDAIGVMQAVTPAERSVLRPAVEGVAGEARRLEVASDALDLDDIAGIEIDVRDLELTASALGDGVAMVDVVGGTLSSSVAIDELPLGPVVREVLDRQDADVDDASDTAPLEGLKLVAIERDGGWRVSLLYSLAELSRRDMDPEPPIPTFGAGIPARGAASPEAVIHEMVDAASGLDVHRLVELTSPVEMEVLHDYGPLLVDAVADADPGTPVEVSDLRLEVHDGVDGRKVVEATSYAVSAGDDEDHFEIRFDGKCTTVTTRYTYTSTFTPVGEAIPTVDVPGETGDLDVPPEPDTESRTETETEKTCIGEESALSPVGVLGTFGSAAAAPRFVVEPRDGAWYLLPADTIFDTLLAGLRAVDTEDVRAVTRMWTGDAEWLWYGDEFWEECGVEQPAATASTSVGEAALEECFSAQWEEGGP